MRRSTSRSERREFIANALTTDASRSDRGIARALGVAHSTVGGVRAELERAGRIQPRSDRPAAASQDVAANLVRTLPGEPGGALKHGADSSLRLAPLRMRLEASLREEFPAIDARRLFLAADLFARIEMARTWLDDRGGVVRNRHGDMFPVVASLESWSRRAETLLRDLRREERERGDVDPHTRLAAIVAELGAHNGGQTDGE
jgi:hypothetical protein